jgi:hypothetical protein
MKICPGLSVASALLVIVLVPAETIADVFAPDGKLDDFCTEVQRILAATGIPSTNTVFTDMGEFRASKPSVNPLMTYQYVTYHNDQAKMISCKVKAADHLVAEYGAEAAGPQGMCRDITLIIHGRVMDGLEQINPALADPARAVVIDPDEPFLTGGSWLSEFPLSYRGDDGAIHINTQSLQINWDDWRFWIMPNRLRGHTYCHLIAPAHMAALISGDAQPDE